MLAGREQRHGQWRVQLADSANGRAGRLSDAVQAAGIGQAACTVDVVGERLKIILTVQLIMYFSDVSLEKIENSEIKNSNFFFVKNIKNHEKIWQKYF